MKKLGKLLLFWGTIPDGMFIYGEAFKGGTSLEEVTLPSTLEDLGA